MDRIPFFDKELLGFGDLVEPGDTVLDIGAAGGPQAVALSLAVGPTGRVHAFEPRPGSARFVQRVVRVARRENVEVHAVAVSDHVGSVTFSVPRFKLTHAHIGAVEDPDWRRLTVPTTTVDAFVAQRNIERVALIRADTEGAEFDVLQGARRTIGRDRPVLVLEASAPRLEQFGRTLDDLDGLVRELGYRAFRYEGRLVPVAALDDSDDDFVFLPSRASSHGTVSAQVPEAGSNTSK